MKKVIGFTTTIPVEVLFAGEYEPCDLNNVFITDADSLRYISRAEQDGFPKNMCNWVKGIYGVVMEKHIETVITVMEGDCSNTRALAEILSYKGVTIIPFSYPYDRDKSILKREIEKLMKALSVDEKQVFAIDRKMLHVRAMLEKIDIMTWKEKMVTGYENHLWLIRSSDMLGDFVNYGTMCENFIKGLMKRDAIKGIPIGYIGVPPMVFDLYEFIESLNAHVVYNETQRQFSLPFLSRGIVERYLAYTYPYGIFVRLKDIQQEVKRRNIRGLIHYVQAFCYRSIEDVILRKLTGVPVLTIEGDLPKHLDGRTKMRIEAFIEVLKHNKEKDL